MTSDAFTLAATGDAIIDPSVRAFDGEDRFDDLLAVLRESDAAVAHLETVVIDGDCRHASLRQATDRYQYLAPFPGAIMGTEPAAVDDLSALGIDLVTAASNHALDFGQDGLARTVAALADRDLPVAGIGESLTAAREPVYADTPAGTVGLVHATTSVPPGGEAGVSGPTFDGVAGVNPLGVEWTYRIPSEQLDQLRAIAETAGIEGVKGAWLRRENPDWDRDEAFYFMHMRFAAATDKQPPGIYQSVAEQDRQAVLRNVERAAAEADRAVAALHAHQSAGGDRNTPDPPAFLEGFARECVDAGADAVVVTGPHTLRGIEVYRERPIYYSLGNFCFHESTVSRIPEEPGAGAQSAVPDVRTDQREVTEDGDVDHGADNWRSVVPVAEFADGGGLTELTLYPCTLQPDAEPPRRGTPNLATGDRARTIIETVADRSAAYGTTVTVDGTVGTVEQT